MHCHLTVRSRSLLAAALVLLAFCRPASGFITRLYSLKEVLDESTHVLLGRLERVDAKKRTAVAVVQRTLKGKPQFKRVQMNIGVGPAQHAAYLIARLKPRAEVIFFYKLEGRNIACCAHANGTWFQLFANDPGKNRDAAWWRFTHVEIYMGRTFDGPTPELIKLVAGVLAGRVKPPKPDPTVPTLDVGRPAPRAVRAPAPGGKRGGFHRQMRLPLKPAGEVRGITWTDVNGDELPDVLFCRQGGNVLLVNQGKAFRDLGRRLGLAGGSRSAGWADYDGDDHPDLMIHDFGLFTSRGGQFRNDSKLLPAPSRRNPEGAGWIDYNGDGLPDLLITNGEHGIRLYENTGRNPQRFRDVSDRAGLGAKGLGVGNGDFVAFFDYDSDGWTDFVYNLGGGVLAHNEGDGTFRLDTGSGIRLNGPGQKRGLAAGDFDNDGDVDLFVPGPGRAQLYRNNNDGTFTDVMASAGDLPKETDASFAAAFGDVDCDGFLDLFVCHTKGSSRLYLGDGKGRFADVSQQAGVRALAPAYAAALADADGDGDPDLAVHLADAAVLAVNELKRPADHGPVTVNVHARRGLIGATVRVTDSKGRPAGLRELGTAQGPGGQAPTVAHFGLRAGKYTVSVCLSDGRTAAKPVQALPAHVRVTFRKEEFK